MSRYRHPLSASTAISLSLLLVCVSLLVQLNTQAAEAAATIALSKSAPDTVLEGGDVEYTLTATNPGSEQEYNLTLRDVLPVGLSYRPGSSTPATLGEPTIRTITVSPGVTRQTLIWSNVSDLAINSAVSLTFAAAVDPDELPVGSQFTNAANAYTNTDPRDLTRFDAGGVVVPGTYTETAGASGGPTTISALEVEKSEPSPEHELMRGVHDHSTVYSIKVTNSGVHTTDAVEVVDYLPAQLEFLGCGLDDNSADVEYPGAPRLDASTPDVPGASCPQPTSVSTVSNPGGYPAGVYTRVAWTLGAFPAGHTETLQYAAGIPQRANAMWPAGSAPAPGSLLQTANLDNNTGPSTRESAGEQGLTNRVSAAGSYSGPTTTTSPLPVSATDEVTVTSEDLAVQKAVTPGDFTASGVATYTFTLRTSEYASASDVVLVDTLPNGLCPLGGDANYAPDAPAECDPAGTAAPTGTDYQDVVPHADGTYTIAFEPITVPASTDETVTFTARMRATYAGGTPAGDPTAAGDSYVNEVDLTGTTSLVPGIDPPGPAGDLVVADESSATQVSSGASLTKTIGQVETPQSCATADYVDDTSAIGTRTFTEGSRVCFTIRVEFSGASETKNATLTDFLPANLSYEVGSATLTGANTVPPGDVSLDTSSGQPVWILGSGTPGEKFVDRGAIFETRFSAIVTQATPPPDPDITGNLAKLRYENTVGEVQALRDEVNFRVPAAPPVSIRKGVSDVNDQPVTPNPPDTDNLAVKAADVVTYRVDLTNGGSAANSNDIDLQAPDVWDVLPEGIDCADVSAISDGGACTDPGDPGHPTFADNATRSSVRWQLPATFTIAAQASRTLTYDLTIPLDTRIVTTYANLAHVRSYETGTNRVGVVAEHLPASNVDSTVDPDDVDAPAASDGSAVVVPNVTLAKSNLTALTEPGNLVTDATIGELVTYTLSVRVPAMTTVYQGRLTDTLPTGLTFVSASVIGFSASNSNPAADPLPPGFALNSSNGQLTFPTTYVNADPTQHLFQVQVVARVSDVGTNVHGTNRDNTARFLSRTAAGGTTELPQPPAATSRVRVVVPAPVIDKDVSADLTSDGDSAQVVAGQVLTYTLRASDTSGRPTLHDAFVVDCLPAGLSFGGFGPVPAGTTAFTASGGGADGCTATQTRIVWSLDSLAASAPQQLTYTATVSSAAAGGQQYANTATLTGSTLDDGKLAPGAADNPDERTITPAVDVVTVTVAGTAPVKTSNTPRRTIGERASWTVTAPIPANVNFYDAALIDQLPIGVDPATIELTSATCSSADNTPCGDVDFGDVLTPGGNAIGFGLGDLSATPQVRTITVTYTGLVQDLPSVEAGDALVNSVRLRWNTTDGTAPTSAVETFDASSAPDTSLVRVTEPDVSVAKQVSDATPAPGQSFTYTVTVANADGVNTSAAHGVDVIDTVPLGIVVDPDSITLGGVLTGANAGGGGTITWSDLGPMAPDDEVELTYEAVLAASADLDGSGLVNTAAVDSYQSLAGGGRTYEGPEDEIDVHPAFPHVSVTKHVLDGPPSYIGEPTTWQITIDSDGTSAAHDIDATDLLPPGWTYDADNPATLSIDGGTPVQAAPVTGQVGGRERLVWSDVIALLPAGSSAVLTLDAVPGEQILVAPGIGGGNPHTNDVGVEAEDATGATSAAAGGYSGPDASAATRIDSADLQVVKSHTGQPVAGGDFSWTVLVTNQGDDSAVGPHAVTDTLPDDVTGASASGPGWACSTAPGSLSCTRNGTLAAGDSWPAITVTGSVPTDLAAGTTLSNAVSVDGRTYDPVEGNNSDIDDAVVTTAADLELRKELSGAMVPGESATWTVGVSNASGPSTSRAPIEVTDTLPEGAEFVSASGTDWSCAAAGREVTCTYAQDIPRGESATQLSVVADIPSSQTDPVVNSATISATVTDDPDPSNDTDAASTDPSPLADVGIEKSSLGDFTPGTSDSYRLRVTNTGPSDTTGVEISDELPPYLDYVGFADVTGDWTCSASDQDVTCTLADSLANGNAAEVDLTVAVAPGHTGAILNTATVEHEADDPDGPDSDTDDTSIAAEADLAITKSHSGDLTAGGDTVAYTLHVRNLGPSDTPGPIVVGDVPPEGLVLESATGSGWSCTFEDDEAVCTRAGGALQGESLPDITVVASALPDAGPAVLTNRADVDGPAHDPDDSNNAAEDPITVDDRGEVTLTKASSDSAPVPAGAVATFTLSVEAQGPSDADDVIVTDPLPAGFTAMSASGDGWACETDAGIVCERDTLAAGTTAPDITVLATVGPGVAPGSTLTNAATVSTTTPGDTPDGNTDDATVDVVASADLQVVKTHPEQDLVAGEAVTWHVAVRNDGPSDAAAPITVVDELPAGFGYLSAGTGWTCSAGLADPDGQQVECVLEGGEPLLAGASAPRLELVATSPSDGADRTHENRVEVESPTDDPEAADNSDSDEVALEASAGLSIDKSHVGAAQIGQELTYELQVANHGPSQATGVTVTDELPAGLVGVSAGGGPWTCEIASGAVSCVLDGALDPGTDAPLLQLVADVTSAAYPSLINSAHVGADGTDPDPSDDVDDDTVTVPSLVDLSMRKVLRGKLVVGERASYRLMVTNEGPTEDRSTIVVTDPLPEGLDFIEADGEGWTCEEVSAVLTCERAAGLAAGESSAVELIVAVNDGARPVVVNVASVGSDSEDSDPDNDSDGVSSPVAGAAEVSLHKSLAWVRGDRVAWDVTVANAGPSPTSEAVVVVDQLPKQLGWVSAGGTGWDCGRTGAQVTCTYGTPLRADGSTTVRVLTELSAAAEPDEDVRNVARLMSGDSSGEHPESSAVLRASQSPTGPAGWTSSGTSTDGWLPDSGGPAWWLCLVGLLATGLGGVLLMRHRRNGREA